MIYAIFKGAVPLFTSNPPVKKCDVAYKVNLQYIKRYLTSFVLLTDRWMDRQMDGQADGRTQAPIELFLTTKRRWT